jgi:FKBP-type peptidyl-prolyl cis-trans isomerase (trigger factor)
LPKKRLEKKAAAKRASKKAEKEATKHKDDTNDSPTIAEVEKVSEETAKDTKKKKVESKKEDKYHFGRGKTYLETKRTEAQFNDDINRMGVKIEDYLKHAKKTIEEIRSEWRPHAEKKAKLQLILNEIVKLEKIEVDVKEIEEEVKHILAHYKDADRERAFAYAETVLTNEKVYQFLEGIK